MKQEQKSKFIKAYINGYRKMPESKEEIEQVQLAGVESLIEEPW